ncbi:hypothetical protein NPIL_643931 [Nephila pilipes]|uniref:Uncharacterized protein n=1 Tax=Nephila pilipes TaxID=299642 RepID=A0A8X6QRY3_NEPPI|nr:hypothetical protein NPIL_643931 [Nephila pilipes]
MALSHRTSKDLSKLSTAVVWSIERRPCQGNSSLEGGISTRSSNELSGLDVGMCLDSESLIPVLKRIEITEAYPSPDEPFSFLLMRLSSVESCVALN